MTKLFYVYMIKNKINGKVYIGKTSGDYNRRWKAHIKKAFDDRVGQVKYKIHSAIAKHGLENFSFKILKTFNTEDEAYQAEIETIIEYDSIKNGYNSTPGGSGGTQTLKSNRKFTKKEIENIFKLFLKEKKFANVGKILNISKSLAGDIIKRRFYTDIKIENSILNECSKILLSKKRVKANFLNKEDIINDYVNNHLSYRQICKKYNTSTFIVSKILKCNIDTSIVENNRCKELDISFVSEVINLYINTNMIAKDLAVKFNVSVHVINDILCGKTSYNYKFSKSEKEKFEKIKKIKSGLKVADDIRLKIIKDLRSGIKGGEVAKKYNISQSLVSYIKTKFIKNK
ncbi:MAG: GIY-YIG nuclease family protein [Chitinophagales bacterium]|nr:GIY-YIG nuclease family protein [Chitinophagales bacterium]